MTRRVAALSVLLALAGCRQTPPGAASEETAAADEGKDRTECAVVADAADIQQDSLKSLAAALPRTARGSVVLVPPEQRARLLQLQDAGLAFGSSVIVAPQISLEKQDAISRIVHGVDTVQQSSGGPLGDGVEVAVIDLWAVWPQHPQLMANGQSRVTLYTAQVTGRHAAHVAGALASAGFPSARGEGPAVPPHYGAITAGEASKGIAPAAKLHSYSSQDCNYDAALASAAVSNLSIVKGAGWERRGSDRRLTWMGPPKVLEDPHFGRYDVVAQSIDRLVFSHATHLVVAAAGNDQDPDHSPSLGTRHWDLDGNEYPGPAGPRHEHEPDDRNEGLKSVHSWCVGKNVLCVGAIEDRQPGGPIVVSSYSNRGPSDDGRVKPDLVANGTTLMSLTNGPRPPLYAFDTGTSYATPNVSGIAALLVQEMRKLRIAVSAAMLKAALIHSAEDDSTPGPDVNLGWGMARADTAVETLRTAALLRSVTIAAPLMLCFAGEASAQPKITAVWTDPPGLLVTAGGDDPTSVLVNDIDLELVPPGGGAAFLPWVLAGATATAGPNHVDNVEVITATGASSQSGTWRLTVRPYRFGASSTAQDVALIVTGVKSAVGC
jgi:subtilisin family serine protease